MYTLDFSKKIPWNLCKHFEICQENATENRATLTTLQNAATVKNLSVGSWTFFANHLQQYICGKLKPKCPHNHQQFFCILAIKMCNILVI